jgi:hypothetical protein
MAMANVHIRMIEDANGNLIDVEYFHHSCAPRDVKGWPAPESVDYPVYCADCGMRMHAVPLTDAGHMANDFFEETV